MVRNPGGWSAGMGHRAGPGSDTRKGQLDPDFGIPSGL